MNEVELLTETPAALPDAEVWLCLPVPKSTEGIGIVLGALMDGILDKSVWDEVGMTAGQLITYYDDLITRYQVKDTLESEAAMIGQIVMYANENAPAGWLLCDGSVYPTAAYADLYAIIGRAYTYLTDSEEEFRVPDFRGRVPVGQGEGDGLSPRTMGTKFGLETHTLTIEQMPAHSHSVARGSSGAPNVAQVSFTAGNNSSPMTTGTTGGSGGVTQAHNNMQPSHVVNFIIYTGFQ